MANFCACDEAGTCYTPLDPPIYAELAPYCDPIEGKLGNLECLNF
jgi:hypothetical protein